MDAPFALWLTGLPACGKSAIARALVAALHERGVDAACLESDVLRTQLTPFPRYDDAERELFYATMVELASFLCAKNVPVILDATGNRRSYRAAARRRIARFAEIHVDTPIEICAARDPKGLYRDAREGRSASLPGAQSAYEPPEQPELVVHGAGDPASTPAQEIMAFLEERRWL